MSACKSLHLIIYKLTQHFFVVSRHDDMMVSDRIIQKILCLFLVCQLDNLLSTAEVCLCLISNQFSFSNKATRHIACHFKDSNRTFLHISSDADTNARLIMGIQFKTLHHIQRNRAMSKQQFTTLRVYLRGITLEARDTRDSLGNSPRKNRRNRNKRRSLSFCYVSF